LVANATSQAWARMTQGRRRGTKIHRMTGARRGAPVHCMHGVAWSGRPARPRAVDRQRGNTQKKVRVICRPRISRPVTWPAVHALRRRLPSESHAGAGPPDLAGRGRRGVVTLSCGVVSPSLPLADRSDLPLRSRSGSGSRSRAMDHARRLGLWLVATRDPFVSRQCRLRPA